MRRVIFSACIVFALISIDATISISYAKNNITIFKVTKVSTTGKLQLRAWPSPKSRIKVSLPYNAVDLTETGKKKMLGKTKWLEVHWKDYRGWVNARYLKKTGVLPNRSYADTKVISNSSRNIKSPSKKTQEANHSTSNKIPAMMEGGNRYDVPIQFTAKEVKTAYSANDQAVRTKTSLKCVGSSPQPWSILMDVVNKKMHVKSQNKATFTVPINYDKWATPNKVRMNVGGNKGRNIVDVSIEKTGACSTGLSRKNYQFEVNATINRSVYSGCCE